MKMLPKKLKKQLTLKKEVDGLPMSGVKGGQVRRRRLETRQIDRELQDYIYR